MSASGSKIGLYFRIQAAIYDENGPVKHRTAELVQWRGKDLNLWLPQPCISLEPDAPVALLWHTNRKCWWQDGSSSDQGIEISTSARLHLKGPRENRRVDREQYPCHNRVYGLMRLPQIHLVILRNHIQMSGLLSPTAVQMSEMTAASGSIRATALRLAATRKGLGPSFNRPISMRSDILCHR